MTTLTRRAATTLPRTSREHYNRFPYDVAVGGGEVYASHPGPLGRFLRTVSGGVALDIGCGPGNLLPALAARAGQAAGVEISDESARLARDRARTAGAVIQGDALRLPLREGCADVAIATGSLHHTGDAAAGFRELCRVLRPGGRAFVAVYRRGSYYGALYRTAGGLARRSRHHPLADLIVNRLVLLPAFWAYFVAGRLAAHRRLRLPSAREVRNYFADQLLNPVVSFHAEAEVRAWAAGEGVDVEEVATTHAGALLNVTLRKRPA
jgi:SAM-dependent methyltransferase